MEKQDNSLSLSLMPAGKYRERTRESGYAIIIPLQVFLPTRNADIRKIKAPAKRGFPAATEFPPSFERGGNESDGGASSCSWILDSRRDYATRHHLRSVAITSLSSRVSQSSLKGS